MKIERQNCNWPDCQHDDERCFFGIGMPCETGIGAPYKTGSCEPVFNSAGDILDARRSARIAWTVTLVVSVAYLGSVLEGWS